MTVSSASDKLFSGIGVCYYPEQWEADDLNSSIEIWSKDAKEMAALGIQYVRIGEFMWHVIEPLPGKYDWGILDHVIPILAAEGIKVVLGTPTATPPKWAIDLIGPENVLPVGEDGKIRNFGSRRHYSFSSPQYWALSHRIVSALGKRYGSNPAVVAWQIDNEFGCHDTVRTYDKNANFAFRNWLKNRYSDIAALNRAWGNRFWSMEYNSFEEVELPNLSVKELNPAHRLDFYRFSSDQVLSYNRMQTQILRELAPHALITHNFMGFFFQFDAFKMAKDLDFVSWDSYPLGFTDTSLGLGELFSEEQKKTFGGTGHPDLASFHHDLYRSMSRGRVWIMEQQPGPVNWGSHNPSPLPGMVRLWTIEAAAHGVDVVSYFRWRQAPYAQEQMHSGLNRRDFVKDTGYYEAKSALDILKNLNHDKSSLQSPKLKKAAILISFESQWYHEIEPQGKEYSWVKLVYSFYSSARSIGLLVDFVAVDDVSSLSEYQVVFVPGIAFIPKHAISVLKQFDGPIIFGPRTGSKTESFQIPYDLPPGKDIQEILPIKIIRVESFRPGVFTEFEVFSSPGRSQTFKSQLWREHLELLESQEYDVSVNSRYLDEHSFNEYSTTAIAVATKKTADQVHAYEAHYLSFFPTIDFLQWYLLNGIKYSKLSSLTNPLPETVRISYYKGHHFAINYGSESASVPVHLICEDAEIDEFLYGKDFTVDARDVLIWKCASYYETQ